MKKILLFLLTISFVFGILTTAYADYQGTIGTRFTITGEGFGNSKSKVYLLNGSKKVQAKVESWSDTSITYLWTNKISPGTYSLFVLPKGKGVAPISAGTLSIRNPIIDAVNPGSAAVNEIITIDGKYFSNKKPKIYLEDTVSLKRKSCKVLSFTMDAATGLSSLQFVVPKLALSDYNQYDLILKNLIGEVRFPPSVAPAVDVTGTWIGTLSTSLLPETPVILKLTQAALSGTSVSITSVKGITKQEVVRAAANVSGTYSLDDVEGTVSGTVNGNTFDFTLNHTTPDCPGTFNGTATINGDAMTFNLSGSDCLGTHSNGQGTANKQVQSINAPTNLTSTAVSTAQINLSWTDNSNNEEHFMVERKTGSGGTYSQIAQVGANVTTYSDTGLTPSTTYYYRARAHSSALGYSGYSNEASANTQGGGTNIADGSFSGSASLYAIRFVVENNMIMDVFNESCGGSLEISTVPPWSLAPITNGAFTFQSGSNYGDHYTLDFSGTFTDNNHANGTYSYSNEHPYMIICNINLEWDATREDVIVTGMPTHLWATAVSSTQINLSWEDNSNIEDYFAIERKMGADFSYSDIGYSEIATVGANVTTYSDTGLSPGTIYNYRIRAHSAALGYSAYSHQAPLNDIPLPLAVTPAAQTISNPVVGNTATYSILGGTGPYTALVFPMPASLVVSVDFVGSEMIVTVVDVPTVDTTLRISVRDRKYISGDATLTLDVSP